MWTYLSFTDRNVEVQNDERQGRPWKRPVWRLRSHSLGKDFAHSVHLWTAPEVVMGSTSSLGAQSLSLLSSVEFASSSSSEDSELDVIFLREATRILTRVSGAVCLLIRGENRVGDVSGLSGCSLFRFVLVFGGGEESSPLRFVVLEICKVSGEISS